MPGPNFAPGVTKDGGGLVAPVGNWSAPVEEVFPAEPEPFDERPDHNYHPMEVVKRNGDDQEMLFDKVTKRIKGLCKDIEVQADKVAQKVFSDMFDGITTTQIDEISADVAIHMITEHPDYETLATRIVVSNMHKTHPKCFSDSMLILHGNGVVSDEFMKWLTIGADAWIDHQRDYTFGYFGLRTLQKMYLNKGETPQYMFMRVAFGIHGDDRLCEEWRV